MSERDLAVVEEFLKRGRDASRRTRERMRPQVPVAELRIAALEHPNPWVRRVCLGILDHEASDESVDVFLDALRDPVAPVREVALHGLACERCRSEALCVPEVVPRLVAALERDPSADVRIKLVGMLLWLAGRSDDALAAICRTAAADGDPLVRAAAELALTQGRPVNPEDLRRRARTRKGKAALRQEPSSPRM